MVSIVIIWIIYMIIYYFVNYSGYIYMNIYIYIDIENIVVWVIFQIYSGFYWIYIYTYIWIILLYGLFCIGLYWLYMDYIFG